MMAMRKVVLLLLALLLGIILFIVVRGFKGVLFG